MMNLINIGMVGIGMGMIIFVVSQLMTENALGASVVLGCYILGVSIIVSRRER